MTLVDEIDSTAAPLDRESASASASPPGAATLATVVVGVLAGALYLKGAFYPVDAFGMAVLALGLVAAGVTWNRDHHGVAVTVAVGGLAAWWFARAVLEHTPAAFFPFGASVLAFLAAYLVTRALDGADRGRVALALVAVGALLAASGVAGVLGRWGGLAQHVGGTWRASTTVTYAGGTAVVCTVAVLVALACDLRSPLVRLATAAGVAGLLATQAHWELVALAVGALVVPRRRWADAVWPLACGAGAGVAVVATSTGPTAGAVAWVVTLGALAASMVAVRLPDTRWARRAATAAVVVLAAGTAMAVLHLPTAGSPPPPGQSQTVAWSSSVDTWRSSPVTGNGPHSIHTTGGAVGTYPGLVPDSYLDAGADGGVIAAVLLLASGAVVAASIRRRDLQTSCAAADTWARNRTSSGAGRSSAGELGADSPAGPDPLPRRRTGRAASPATLPPSRAMAGSCQAKSTQPVTANATVAAAAHEVCRSRRRMDAATTAPDARSRTAAITPPSAPASR